MEQEFAAAIEIISTQLGIAAEKIFHIFAEAQVIIGIVNIILAIIGFILTYLVYKYACRAVQQLFKGEEDNFDFTLARLLVPIIFTVFAFLIIITGLSAHNHDIIRILCPEYAAMKEIIELITNV